MPETLNRPRAIIWLATWLLSSGAIPGPAPRTIHDHHVLALDLASVSGWAVGEPGGEPSTPPAGLARDTMNRGANAQQQFLSDGTPSHWAAGFDITIVRVDRFDEGPEAEPISEHERDQRVDLVRFEDRLHGYSQAGLRTIRASLDQRGLQRGGHDVLLVVVVRHLPRRGGGVKIGRARYRYRGQP